MADGGAGLPLLLRCYSLSGIKYVSAHRVPTRWRCDELSSSRQQLTVWISTVTSLAFSFHEHQNPVLLVPARLFELMSPHILSLAALRP